MQRIGRAALVTPNTDPEKMWMISAGTRQLFAKRYYATIVPIAYNSSFYDSDELEDLDNIQDNTWHKYEQFYDDEI